MLVWPSKDPNEYLDYNLDWSARLTTGDPIVAQEWFQSEGDALLLMSNMTIVDGARCVVWLADGTLSTSYVLTNRVTTSAGRIMDTSVKIKIQEK